MAKSKTGAAPKMAGLGTKKSKSKTASKPEASTAAVAVDAKDVLAGTANEVEQLTKPKALKLAPELVNSAGANDFKLGGVLARIQEEGWWEGSEHESFKLYVENVLGLKYRKSMYLINIFDKLVEAGVSWADVSSIGWSKLRFIVDHLTAKNAPDWAKRCDKMNALQIQDYVKQLELKKAKKGSKDTGEPEVAAVSTMSFKVHADQKDMIREALDKKKDEIDTEFDTVALENLAIDYVEGTTGKGKKVTKASVTEYLTNLGEEKAAALLISIYPNLEGEEEEEEEGAE